MDKFRLDAKISLITGGSREIVYGIAKALVETGSDTIRYPYRTNMIRGCAYPINI